MSSCEGKASSAGERCHSTWLFTGGQVSGCSGKTNFCPEVQLSLPFSLLPRKTCKHWLEGKQRSLLQDTLLTDQSMQWQHAESGSQEP